MPIWDVHKWFITKRYLINNRFKVYTYTFNGKKYLTIKKTGWRGVKWERRFEITAELDSEYRPIPFDGKEAVRP